MSYPIDEAILFNFLANHTRPLRLSALPLDPSSQRCPICHEAYHARDPFHVHPILSADAPEYPVQIRDRGLCRHIFGRHCMEKQIRSHQPWITCVRCVDRNGSQPQIQPGQEW